MKKLIGEDDILKTVTELIFPFILLLGIYIIMNGHLSPGGGFSGGTVLGSSLILQSVAFGVEETRKFFKYSTFLKLISISLLFYGLVKGYSFMTGAAHIESIVPLGTPGKILSGGLILPLNIAVGIIVASTIYGLFTLFSEGDI